MGSTPPTVYTVQNIKVTIAGVTDSAGDFNALLFNSCDGPSWSIDAPKHVFHGTTGPDQIISAIQNPTWSPMTLTQGWDQNFCMAKWKATIEDPTKSIDDKKKDVKVDFLQSDGTTILFSWHTTSGLLTSYQTSGSDPSSHAALIVSTTIDADKWEQLDSSGSPITGS